MVYARGAPRGQSLSAPSQPQARGIMPPFLLLLGRPPGADAGSAFLPTRCSCCHLGSTQLLEEVGESPQGAEGFATGPELCGGRPHPEGRVTGKLRLKNETRSPQPSARSRRAQAERAMATLLTRVCEAAGRFPMSRWQTRTPQLSPARAGSGPKAGSSGRWRTCQGPLGNSLGDPRPVAGLLTSPR